MTGPARRTVRWLGLAGGAAAAVTLAGVVVRPDVAFPVYLAAYLGAVAVPIGCLFVMLLACLVGGRWAEDLRRPLELGALAMPVAALLFLPILAGLDWVYPWARVPLDVSVPAFRRAWLSMPFFTTRACLILGTFTGLTVALLRVRDAGQRSALGSLGLIAFALLASCAGIDWGMSVEPGFHSSIWGLVFIGGAILSGLSFALVGALWSATRAGSARTFGALLVAAILLWAYLHAMQYVVIWSADIPREAAWYLVRTEGGWGGLLWVIALAQFALPVGALLLRRVRRSPAGLIVIALASIPLRGLEAAWLVLPPLRLAGPWGVPLFGAAALAISCLGLAGALWLRDRVALPRTPGGIVV